MMTMLGELDRGETGELNTQLLLFEFSEKGFSKDALSLVNCADSAPKLSRDDYIKQAKIIDSEARYDDIKERSDDDYLDACYYWQWQATDDLNENLITNDTPNLLFVAQKYDLATPLANAVNMAKRFDDTLIYTPNHGHTVSLSGMNACVDGYVVQYLLDPKIQFDNKVILCE
ncbi:MAG: alpha/beta hydrolase [Moraxella equi]|nr:alpha/beta hydrolase [Moraxella equi]